MGAQPGALAMWTFTSRPGSTWADVMKAWQRLLLYLRRKYGLRCEYVAVKEAGGKTGMLHLHCILLGWRWVPWAAVSAEWERLTGAWHVWVSAIRTSSQSEIARYLSKYLTKEAMVGARKAVTYSEQWPRREWQRPAMFDVTMYSEAPVPRPIVAETDRGLLVEHWGAHGSCECFGGVMLPCVSGGVN